VEAFKPTSKVFTALNSLISFVIMESAPVDEATTNCSLCLLYHFESNLNLGATEKYPILGDIFDVMLCCNPNLSSRTPPVLFRLFWNCPLYE